MRTAGSTSRMECWTGVIQEWQKIVTAGFILEMEC